MEKRRPRQVSLIKVDKCSEGEGVWLDAGELEAISRFEKTGLDKLFSMFKK